MPSFCQDDAEAICRPIEEAHYSSTVCIRLSMLRDDIKRRYQETISRYDIKRSSIEERRSNFSAKISHEEISPRAFGAQVANCRHWLSRRRPDFTHLGELSRSADDRARSCWLPAASQSCAVSGRRATAQLDSPERRRKACLELTIVGFIRNLSYIRNCIGATWTPASRRRRSKAQKECLKDCLQRVVSGHEDERFELRDSSFTKTMLSRRRKLSLAGWLVQLILFGAAKPLPTISSETSAIEHPKPPSDLVITIKPNQSESAGSASQHREALSRTHNQAQQTHDKETASQAAAAAAVVGGPAEQVPAYMQHVTLILVCLHLSVFVSGLVGNSLVCLSVLRNKSLQTVTNYYIVNLAVADFLVILICLPPTVYWDLTLTWNFGLVLCKLVLYLQSISVSVSVLTLTCISIDRWYAICRPLEFSSTKYRAKITICLIWLLSLLIASPDAIFLTTKQLYEEDSFVYTDCTYEWPESSTKIYQLCIVTLLFACPFVLMTISYAHIVNVLWRNEIQTGAFCHAETTADDATPTATDYANLPSSSSALAEQPAPAPAPDDRRRRCHQRRPDIKAVEVERRRRGRLAPAADNKDDDDDDDDRDNYEASAAASVAPAAGSVAVFDVGAAAEWVGEQKPAPIIASSIEGPRKQRPRQLPQHRRRSQSRSRSRSRRRGRGRGGRRQRTGDEIASIDRRAGRTDSGGARAGNEPPDYQAAAAAPPSRPKKPIPESENLVAGDISELSPSESSLSSLRPSSGRDEPTNDEVAGRAGRPGEAARSAASRSPVESGHQPGLFCCGCRLGRAGSTTTTTTGRSDAGHTSRRYRRNLANYAARCHKYGPPSGSNLGSEQRPPAQRMEPPASPSETVAIGGLKEAPSPPDNSRQPHRDELHLPAPTAAGQRRQLAPHQPCLAAPAPASANTNNARFCKLIESRKKAAKMLIVIVIMFGLCYLPVHFLNTLRYTIGLPQNDITTIASLVSHWLCYFNSAINPLIYNLMSGKFRKEFADLFFCRCFGRKQQQ